MKKLVQVVFSSILLVSISGYAQTKEQTAKIAGISKKLATLNARLGPDVREVDMNWKGNSEVKTVLSYPTFKRIAAINAIISILQENETKIFPQLDKNQSQLAGMIISRVFAYSYIRELTTDSDDDIAVRDFLDGELSDLKLTLNQKISYGVYVQSRKQRSDKVKYLLMTNKYYVEELLILNVAQTSVVSKLTNKTTAIALMKTCVQNLELCENL